MNEKPVVFGRENSLVGINCAPAEPAARGTPVALFLNAGIIHRIGPNRLYVHIARRLAARGIASFRFDLGGVGDSLTSAAESCSVLEMVERDLTDAIDCATRENGADRVVLIGLCSGADNALQTALRDDRVAGAVLLDPNAHRILSFYVHHYARALFNANSWKLLLTGRHPFTRRLARRARNGSAGDAASLETAPFLAPTTLPPRNIMHEQLRSLVNRDCRLMFLFTGGMPYRYNHARQFARTFPGLASDPRIDVRYHADWDHTFSSSDRQNELAALIEQWLGAHWADNPLAPAA